MEKRLERPDCDGLDMCRGGIMNILVEGCLRWSYQAKGREETHGCGERRYAEEKGEMEEDDSL